MKYDILEFIDSPDMREANKNTFFTPAQQVILVSQSEKTTVFEKIEMLEHLLDMYTEEEFEEGKIVFDCMWDRGMSFYENTKHMVQMWKDILADRVVNGVQIQSKYCKTGGKCISECFENGRFRYINSDGTPMQIEVPSDRYEAAISAMKDCIRRGEVPGVINPEDASDIVRKGHFTYEQVRNIAKAGIVESFLYDSANGEIIATSTLGITTILSFATAVWNGESTDDALKKAAYAGIKVGGPTFVTAVFSGQLSKAELNSLLVRSSESTVKSIGPKYSYGAVAMKRGIGGCIGGPSMASIIIESGFPIIATAVGATVDGFIGTFGGGVVAGKISESVTGAFLEDDAEEMVKIIEKILVELASEYLLTEKEVGNVIEGLRGFLTGKCLKDMFAAPNREEYAKRLILAHIESNVSNRKKIRMPDKKTIFNVINMIFKKV